MGFYSFADGCVLVRDASVVSATQQVKGRTPNRLTFRSTSGPEGEPVAVYASTEMLMPAYLPGTAAIATPDQIILVLGDFRGDIWLMDL